MLPRESKPAPRPCSSRCESMLSRLEDSLKEAQEKVTELEEELQHCLVDQMLEPPLPSELKRKDQEIFFVTTCQIHGRPQRRTRRNNRFLWGSWQKHTVHSGFNGPQDDFYGSSHGMQSHYPDFADDYVSVWPLPVHVPVKRTLQVDEIETVL